MQQSDGSLIIFGISAFAKIPKCLMYYPGNRSGRIVTIFGNSHKIARPIT